MLSSQRYELVHEVKRCVMLLGLNGELHDLLNIGDHGKVILALKRGKLFLVLFCFLFFFLFFIGLRMKGQFRIVHDVEASPSEVAHVLERASVTPIASFERIDYANLRENEFPQTPDQSMDLVTMMQGLHHLPPAQLGRFISGVFRVLRPGGLFIIREHDLRDESFLPMVIK